MLLSISLILIVGMAMGWICQKIKLPGLDCDHGTAWGICH